MNTIKLGTRASDLAMEQARETSRALTRACPDLNVAIVPVHALGDHDKVSPIAKLGARGVFVSTLEDRLRSGEIDAAVHSLKDMPTDTAEGFVLAAVLERLDPRDVLLTSNGCGLKDLAPNARVGTGSPRRAVQIKAARPDIEITGIRGNIDTRIRKLNNGDYDAIVLAAAGLIRMGWQDRIALSTSQLRPASLPWDRAPSPSRPSPPTRRSPSSSPKSSTPPPAGPSTPSGPS